MEVPDRFLAAPIAHRLAMTEVAERGLNRRTVSPALSYAQRVENDAKRAARRRLLNLWTQNAWPKGLSILTMPGMHWRFEFALLQARETKSVINGGRQPGRSDFVHSVVRRTYIESVERNPAVFLGAIRSMPGARRAVAEMSAPAYASRSLKSPLITRFHLAEVERLLLMSEHPHDAVWLDFNGPLTEARIEGIRRIWGLGLVRTHLAVTLLAARQTARYDADDVAGLLLDLCPGSSLLDAFHYRSGRSPMSQLVLGRSAS